MDVDIIYSLPLDVGTIKRGQERSQERSQESEERKGRNKAEIVTSSDVAASCLTEPDKKHRMSIRCGNL